jgi:hypothetical protein
VTLPLKSECMEAVLLPKAELPRLLCPAGTELWPFASDTSSKQADIIAAKVDWRMGSKIFRIDSVDIGLRLA